MKKNRTITQTFDSNVLAEIKTTFKKNEQVESIVYKLIKTQDTYKITTNNNLNENFGIEDFILFETKHRIVAVKMFAHLATNDIEELYMINNNQIGR